MPTRTCTFFYDFAAQSLQNWKTIGETNLKLAEKLLGTQVEIATALLDLASMNGEEISHTKDMRAIAELQAEMIQESGKLIFEGAQSTATILADAGKAYGRIFETSLKAGADFAKPANVSKKEAA